MTLMRPKKEIFPSVSLRTPFETFSENIDFAS
jgi:hypothetical protein